MSVEFEAFEVPGARTYYGNALPFGLQVKSQSSGNGDAPSVSDSTAALRALAESGKMNELLDRHGAVLVRGIGHPSPETFSEVINAIEEGRGSHPYEQIGLAGKRNIKAKNVWSANEGAPTTRFYQHNEVSKIESCGERCTLTRLAVLQIYKIPCKHPLLFC
jgi:hypothetical protein